MKTTFVFDLIAWMDEVIAAKKEEAELDMLASRIDWTNFEGV